MAFVTNAFKAGNKLAPPSGISSVGNIMKYFLTCHFVTIGEESPAGQRDMPRLQQVTGRLQLVSGTQV